MPFKYQIVWGQCGNTLKSKGHIFVGLIHRIQIKKLRQYILLCTWFFSVEIYRIYNSISFGPNWTWHSVEFIVNVLVTVCLLSWVP